MAAVTAVPEMPPVTVVQEKPAENRPRDACRESRLAKKIVDSTKSIVLMFSSIGVNDVQ